MPRIPESEGFIAILDALGAASYSARQIDRFIDARSEVLTALQKKAEHGTIEGHQGELEGVRLKTFTFGDTLLIAYVTEHGITPQVLVRFFALIRQFLVDSLSNGILLRGSIGVGGFFIEDETNTVLGDAVADAAGWYDQTDWIGAVATPRTTLTIDRLLGGEAERKKWAFVRYSAPLKNGQKLSLYCVNWPKVFLVPHLVPGGDVSDPRRSFLDCLRQQTVPVGTESKYFNSVEFFDYCATLPAAKRVGGGKKARAPARPIKPSKRTG